MGPLDLADIEELTVKQGQQRDKVENAPKDKAIKATDKAHKAGNITDREHIENLKNAPTLMESLKNSINKSWEGARTVENWKDPFDVTAAATARTLEILKPDDWRDAHQTLIELAAAGHPVKWAGSKLIREIPIVKEGLDKLGDTINRIRKPRKSVGAAGTDSSLSPSSGDIENIENVLNPERLARIKNLKNELREQIKPFIEESRANIAATKNPYIPQRTRIELAGVSKNSGYERGGTFRYKKFKLHQSNMEEQGRSWLGIFQAGFTEGGASKAVPFNNYRHVHKKALLEEFGPTLQAMGITESSLQIHHIAALKSIMGIFDGLQLNSRMFRQVHGAIMKEIPGLGLGNTLGNFKPVVGKTSDIGTPHYLVHRFYNDRLGKLGQGEDFFTEKVLRRMKVDPSYRLEKAREIGQVIRESEQIVTQAQKVYKTLYAQSTTLDDVLEIMGELNDKGMINLFDEKYQVDNVQKIIETIVNDIEINGFPTKLGPNWWQEAQQVKKILRTPTNKRGSGPFKSLGKEPRQIKKTYKNKSKDK